MQARWLWAGVASALLAVSTAVTAAAVDPSGTSSTVPVSGVLHRVSNDAPGPKMVLQRGTDFVPVDPDRFDVEKLHSAPSGAHVRLDLRAPSSARSTTERVASAMAAARSAGSLTPVDATITAQPQSAIQVTPGVHPVTVALVRFSGSSLPANSASAVTAQLQAASSYWSDQSDGAVTFAPVSVKTVTIASTTCDDAWKVWSQAAAATGFVDGPRKHLVVSVNPQAGCGYGLGTIGADASSGGVLYVSDTAWPVLAHELGHNLGLEHAEALICSRADADLRNLGGCSVNGYGDPYDVMAASAPDTAGSLSTSQAAHIGVLPSAAVASVNGDSGSFTLNPVSSGRGLRSIKITDPRTAATYVVEYRTRTGRDARLYANLTPGVRVLKVVPTEYDTVRSIALDATPTGSTSDLARHVPVGRDVVSTSGGVVLHVMSAGDTASVSVESLGTGQASRGTVATAPRLLDACGTARDGVIIPSTPSVTYAIDGKTVAAGTHPASGTVVVEATADTPAYLVGTRSWTLRLDGRACAAAVTTAATNVTASRAARIALTWRGSGPSGDGTLRYDVNMRSLRIVGGKVVASTPVRLVSNTLATSRWISGAQGGVYEFAVRTRDASGAVGPWSRWAKVSVAMDERVGRTSWKGTWASVGSATAYAGTLRTTTAAASLTRAGVWTDHISVVGLAQPAGSRAAVYVDGVYRGVLDSAARVSKARAVLFTVAVPWGVHTVTIVNKPRTGHRALAVDGVAYGRTLR